MPKTVLVICGTCEVEFEKTRGEFNRSEKRGMGHYCGHRCSVSACNRKSPRNTAHIRNFADNQRDAETPFRWFVARARFRKRPGKIVTAAYLKKLWLLQAGRCPFTGWELVLPVNTSGWRADVPRSRRASLDRIDCRKGYEVGNVRFVSLQFNLARCDLADLEVVEFCKAVAARHLQFPL